MLLLAFASANCPVETELQLLTSRTVYGAVVDSLGTVRGMTPGTAVITARTPSGKEGSATIVVIPSTIAYHITIGGPPEALAFSVDATRLYVPVRPDSLAVIDALGQLRVATVSLGAGANRAAATTTHVIAFEAGASSAAATA